MNQFFFFAIGVTRRCQNVTRTTRMWNSHCWHIAHIAHSSKESSGVLMLWGCSYSPSFMRCDCAVWCSHSPRFTCSCDGLLNIFDDLFWWEAPQPRYSNQIVPVDEAHQTKGKDRDWMENEVMNLKRTGGVKNEMTSQGMCNTFNCTKCGEEDSTRCLRCSIQQELFVCSFGERHPFPSHLMCCECGGVLVFLCCAHIV